jgi:hypothetical protein
LVQSLSTEGLNPCQIGRVTGIPRSTIRYWLREGYGRTPRRREIDPRDVPPDAYAYLLGLYLGDGHIARSSRTYVLRLYMDSRYPGINEEARQSIAAVIAPNRASILRRQDANMVVIQGHSNSLPHLFPQHGSGPKHARPIVLEDWQERIVDQYPELFLRGLIHSDGCRVTNRVWRGKYAYPRYFFSQVSTDIMELFCRTCRQLGISYAFNNPRSVSIARAASVARLDEFVGPKS